MSSRLRTSLLLSLACAGTACMSDEPRHGNEAPVPDFDALWRFDDPAESERVFRALLAEHEGAGERWRLELRTQLARALGLQMRFDEALAELNAVAEADGADDARVRVRALLERGRVLRSRGDERGPAPALFFVEAWERARAAGEDGLAVDAAHMLALAPPDGDTPAEWNARALALAEESADPTARRWRGALWNNVGWTHHDAGELEQALHAFERSRDAFTEDGREPRARVARWAIARTLRSMDRHADALARQRELEAELSALGEVDGYVYEELAENLLALGRGDEAARWFGAAFDALREDPWLARDEPERLARMERLAER